MNAPVFLQRKVTFTQRHKRKCYNIDLFWFAKEIKIIRVKSQANKPPCVSATRGKLLPKETRFQFPHCVMKIVLFPKVFTIFKLIYLFWFFMEQTLDLALLASRRLPFRQVFSAPVSRELCYFGETISSFQDPSTPQSGKTIRGRPV